MTVSLPVELAGIRDRRLPFAAVFARELGVGVGAGADQLAPWVYGVPADATLPAERVDALEQRFRERRRATSVLIIPGLFGDCIADQSVPFGDGVRRTPVASVTEAYAQYAGLGVGSIRMVTLPGRAPSTENAALLVAAIRAEAARTEIDRIVLVAYSKGTADTLQALATLEDNGGLPAQLKALVSVAGVVMGSPIGDGVESLYAAVSPRVTPFHCTESRGDELASVTRRERIAWLAAHAPPRQLAYYSIVAYAEAGETAWPLRTGQRLLALADPRNDGQVIAADAILPGSELLATARSDHWDIALPRDRHPNLLMRSLSSGRAYPREALFRALVKWAVGNAP